MDLARNLRRLHETLRASGVDHALIGGLALAAHGVVRATQDVDLLVDGETAEAAHGVVGELGYRALHRSENAANYAGTEPADGRVDFLFARRRYARAMLTRARAGALQECPALRVVDPADLIGLKVQSSSNDPRRARRDMEDVARLLEQCGDTLDLARVREYFRVFEREGELDALLTELAR